MQIIRDLAEASQISNRAIRELVQQRIRSLSEQGFAIEDVGHFVVVDSSDTVASIEQHLGVSISAYEMAEQYPSCFDLVYLLDQAGKGIELFLPNRLGGDIDLLAMCAKYATPPFSDEGPP